MIIERRPVRVGDVREDRVAILEGVEPAKSSLPKVSSNCSPGARVRIDSAAHLEPQAVRPKE